MALSPLSPQCPAATCEAVEVRLSWGGIASHDSTECHITAKTLN